jgi:uncharacterized beta-barrel protein YwiB (DUF1934 family)
MLINFEMISENLNINFKVFGKRDDNILTFPDKSVPNTTMMVIFKSDAVIIKRYGSVSMEQSFVVGEQLTGFYKNDMGLEFEIRSFTTELIVEENKIEIFYEHYLEDKWQSSNKLKILF